MSSATPILLLLAACDDARLTPESPASSLKGEVDLAEHPPAIDDITVEITSAQRADNATLTVTYAEGALDVGEISLTLSDGEPVTISDDGLKPDVKAGDGVYTGTITFDLAGYVERFESYTEAAGALEDPIVGAFDGFTRTGETELDLEAIGPSFQGEPVDVDLSDPVGLTLTLFSGTLPALAATTDPEATLAVRNLDVVSDRTRTGYWHWDGTDCTQVGDPDGVWGFNYLMNEINAGGYSGIPTSEFIEEWLKEYTTTQTVNGQTVHIDGAGFRDLWNSIPFTYDDGVINQYTDSLDISELPFQLIAITNRLDVRDATAYGGDSFGELRFVFGIVDTATCQPLQGTIIFEFGVPVDDCGALQTYAQEWYDLSTHTLGSASYNQALEDITEQVVPAGLAPGKPNESAINQIRSNELEFAWGTVHYPDNNWDLKEFILPSDGAYLAMNTVAMTPAYSYELPDHTTGAQPIDDFIDTYTSDILGGTYTVDLTYPGTTDPFRGAYVPYGDHDAYGNGASREFDVNTGTDFPPHPLWPGWYTNMERLMFWGSDLVSSYEARHVFSINTCSGCHGHETIEPGSSVTGATADDPFLHIEMQPPGQQARFSRFMTGTMDNCTTTDGLVAPLGTEVCSASCCPIGDPAFGDTVAQYHYDELERRSQDLDHLVYSDCTTLLGVDWLNDAITQAAH